MTWRTSAAAAEAEAIAHGALWNGGKLRIYTGSQPASVATAISGTLLCEITPLGTPAYVAGGSDGLLTLAGVPLSANGVANGTAGWATLMQTDNTRVDDFAVGMPSVVTSSTLNSTTTVTMASTTGITAGMQAIGTGIPVGATVASVTNGTTLVLSVAATVTGTQTLSFAAAGIDVVLQNTSVAAGQPVTITAATFTWGLS
jgi:hypothetical protein